MTRRGIPERILLYTHNSIGLGHAVRSMAIIDGLRAALPEADFLVVTGGIAPQIFLSQGIETVRLPGLRHCLELPGEPFRPRFLRGLERDEVTLWRQNIIQTSLEAFRPDVVFVEHSLVGLLGEAVPLLAGARRLCPGGYLLAHLSRGIYREQPKQLVTCTSYPGLPGPLYVTKAYDAFYVFEDRCVVDVNREFFGQDPEIENKIHYLGRICAKNREELEASPGLAEIGLREPLVLLSLGRHGNLPQLHKLAFKAVRSSPELADASLLAVLDPYLCQETQAEIRRLALAANARTAPFRQNLAELIGQARLAVCRCGYNILNELLITRTPALVIPEHHPSQEQERRALLLGPDQFRVKSQEHCLAEGMRQEIEELMALEPVRTAHRFDRFKIGWSIARDLERLLNTPVS